VFRLFQPLHANSGLGIGLSLCKKIVENHHGSISIDSVPGEGTLVTFTLPLRQE
jgi:sigma-B regulation protein RsbU (phosphoserine phosphatase)